jgi:hypothetical protein
VLAGRSGDTEGLFHESTWLISVPIRPVCTVPGIVGAPSAVGRFTGSEWLCDRPPALALRLAVDEKTA